MRHFNVQLFLSSCKVRLFTMDDFDQDCSSDKDMILLLICSIFKWYYLLQDQKIHTISRMRLTIFLSRSVSNKCGTFLSFKWPLAAMSHCQQNYQPSKPPLIDNLSYYMKQIGKALYVKVMGGNYQIFIVLD